MSRNFLQLGNQPATGVKYTDQKIQEIVMKFAVVVSAFNEFYPLFSEETLSRMR